MANLAIKGHATRGKEVIEILEMFGGENGYKLSGTNEKCAYYEKNGRIHNTAPVGFNNFKLFTLEEFIKKFPYKVGDKVIYKSEVLPIIGMKWDCFHNIVIYTMNHNYGVIDCYDNTWMKPYKEETMEEDTWIVTTADKIDFTFARADKIKLKTTDTYEVVVENGETYVVRKKAQYPKTYEECCKVLGVRSDWHLTLELVTSVTHDLYITKEFDYVVKLESLRKLLICRDAYWKIAGEQMGLGKPWEPDWGGFSEDSYPTITKCNDRIVKTLIYTHDCIFSFPTEEMRDAFYENFKDMIEQCKELL